MLLQSPSTCLPRQPLKPSSDEGESQPHPRAAQGIEMRTATPAHLLMGAKAAPRRQPVRVLRTEHCSRLSTSVPHGSRIRKSRTS